MLVSTPKRKVAGQMVLRSIGAVLLPHKPRHARFFEFVVVVEIAKRQGLLEIVAFDELHRRAPNTGQHIIKRWALRVLTSSSWPMSDTRTYIRSACDKAGVRGVWERH